MNIWDVLPAYTRISFNVIKNYKGVLFCPKVCVLHINKTSLSPYSPHSILKPTVVVTQVSLIAMYFNVLIAFYIKASLPLPHLLQIFYLLHSLDTREWALHFHPFSLLQPDRSTFSNSLRLVQLF
jgi:hypothetical protein